MTEVIFILHAIIALIISATLAFYFIKNFSNSLTSQAFNVLANIFFVYMLIFLISILWFLGYMEYDQNSFLVIYNMAIFTQNIILFLVFKKFSSKNKLFLLFLIYIIPLLTLFISLKYTLVILILISLFVNLLFFLVLFPEIFSKSKFVWYFGMIYCLLGIILNSLWTIKSLNVYPLILILNLVFLAFIISLCKNLIYYEFKKEEIKKDYNYFQLFIRYFLFIIVMICLTLISTIVLHELGHVLFAKFLNCSYKTIFFEQGSYPYTEVLCPNNPLNSYSLISGPIFPILVAFVMLISRNKLFKQLSLLIIGFNLIASFRDFLEIGLSSTIVLTSQIIGFIFLMMGVVLMSKLIFEQSFKADNDFNFM